LSAARKGRAGALASEAARGSLALLLAPLEAALVRSAPETGAPPVFIVGPPRSGTTLLSQVLVHCYRFAPFTNLAHRLHRTPLAAAWLGRALLQRQASAFDSRFGHVAGWGAPSEGGRIWSRWMPEFGPLDEGAAARLPVAEIRRTVFGTAQILGAPFLNKNVMHSVHVGLLDALFPGCLFLEIRRAVRDNVRSIVRAREAGGGPTDAEGWWSVRPAGAEAFLAAEPVVQAAAQVRLVRETIERDAARLGEGRRLVIEYADLCADPAAVCARVERSCGARGVALAARAAPPAPFPLHGAQALDASSERRLEAALGGAPL
jgi:hypothetical protein